MIYCPLHAAQASPYETLNQGSRYKWQSLMLPESLKALMLIANASIDNTQRVSVLAAASPTGPDLDSQSTNAEFMKAVSYQSVSSVLRQCNRPHDTTISQSNPIISNAATTEHFRGRNINPRGRPKLSPLQLLNLKSRSQCRTCKKYGHWSGDHNPDGRFKPQTLEAQTTLLHLLYQEMVLASTSDQKTTQSLSTWQTSPP